ncbi:MAG: hypothetical protein JNL58_00530 [Planctomyces sp.]|nr:hypothetical protein [Planctomyces sp.]
MKLPISHPKSRRYFEVMFNCCDAMRLMSLKAIPMPVKMLLCLLALSILAENGMLISHAQQDARSAEDVSESRVLEFAKEHHPELAGLLEQLRTSRSKEFNKAMRELSGQVQKLDRIRERTPARFEHELGLWKNESQTRLLVARWVMSQDPELEKEIRGLLKQRHEMKLTQLKLDRDKLTERLKALETQVETAESDPDAQIEEEWKKLSRRNNRKASESLSSPPPSQKAKDSKQ